MTKPSVSSVKRLFALSGNRCAFPDCSSSLVDKSGTGVGEICHIRGRKRGSARFDPSQTDEERHGFDNLVLMCPSHHAVIDDNEEVYTVEALLEIKREHETHSEKVEEPKDQVAQQLIANIEAHGHYNIRVVSHNQFGGITAGIVNINAAPEPTLEWQEVLVNRLDNEEYHSRISLRIVSPYPPANLSITVHAPSIRRTEPKPQRVGLFEVGYTGVRKGYAFTNIPHPVGSIYLDIFTGQPESAVIEYYFE